MTVALLRSEHRRLEARVLKLEEDLRTKDTALGALEREMEITRREYELKLAEAQAKLKDLLRRLFGPSSEKIDPKQHLLALESLEADQALAAAEPPVPAQPPEPPKPRAKRGARRPLPANLPVERVVHDLPDDQKRDPSTGEPLRKIREELTEEIDYRPSRFVRVQHVVPVYASPSKSTAPVQALLERVLPGSGVGTGLLAHITVSKHQDHLPLYRLEQIAARQGVTLDRSKMSKWVEHVALLLGGLAPALERHLFASGYVQCDETTVKVLDPERPGAARQAYLWVRHAPIAKVIVFNFDPTRRHEVALGLFPPEYEGIVQSDCYQAYDAIKRQRPGVVAVHCWAHARRKWVEAVDNGGQTVAVILALIAELYKVETEARGLPFARREQLRASRSQILLARLRSQMEAAAASALPSSRIGLAAAYALSRWEALTRFAEPGFGHVEIDNNPIENGLRPTALGRNYAKEAVMESGAEPEGALAKSIALRVEVWFRKCGGLFRASSALDPDDKTNRHHSARQVGACRRAFHNSRLIRRVDGGLGVSRLDRKALPALARTRCRLAFRPGAKRHAHHRRARARDPAALLSALGALSDKGSSSSGSSRLAQVSRSAADTTKRAPTCRVA